MKIGIDIMGGDFAPESAVLGAIEAYKILPAHQNIVLIGNKNLARPFFQSKDFNPDLIEFIHTEEVISMAESPTRAITKKPNSSLALGFELLLQGKIDSFASAGNTGAMLVGCLLSVKSIPGVIRPALTTIVPKLKGGMGLLLDVGVNADCKADSLVQFAILGKIFVEKVYKLQNPRVGLLNIGEEEEKGNMLMQSAFPLMKESELFNFIGNVEGRDLFNDKADIIVCDGFTGNAMLKLAESFYEITMLKGFKDEFFDRCNYEQYGGSPILGVNAPVIVGHGISTAEAIKNMIFLSRDVIITDLVEDVKNAFLCFLDTSN